MKKLALIGFLLCVSCFVLTGCNQNMVGEKEITICLQPYNGFPQTELIKLRDDIENCLDTLVPEMVFNVEILDDKTIPEQYYIHPKNGARYRADSIIRYQKRFGNPNYILGITQSEICADVHNVSAWGILGLSFCPGKSSVVSNYRVRNKALFYKVAVHELLHCLELPHCGQKDRSCYICDANKTPQLEKQTRLCAPCREKLYAAQAIKTK